MVVIGPIDHSFCQFVYFFDPSGHRLEITVRTGTEGDTDRFAEQAKATLVEWQARKSNHAP